MSTLDLEDVYKIISKLLGKKIRLPYRASIQNLLLGVLRVGYTYSEWKGKIELLLTLQSFNALIDALIEHGFKVMFTEQDYMDCIEVSRETEKPIVVCDDYDLSRAGLKRITMLNLEVLRRYLRPRIVIENYRGSSLINYVRIVYTVKTDRKIPIFYILYRLNERDLMLGVRACLEREFESITEDVIAYSIMYYMKSVDRVENVKFFVTRYVVAALRQYIDNCIVNKYDGNVEVYAEGTCLARCTCIDCDLYILNYIDVPALLKHGVDVQVMRVG